MNLGTEKEMNKPKVGYEMCGDKVFLVIPQGNYNERRLVMTKDLFRICYEHWIKKAENNTENPIAKNISKEETSKPSDLISKEEAVSLVEEWRQFALGHNEYGEKLAGCIKAGIEKISTRPSTEKTGKWSKKEYVVNGRLTPNYVCSQCGYWSRDDYYYCPNCGAYMKEE